MFQKYIAFIFFINIQYKFHVIDSLMHFITSIYLQKLFIIFFLYYNSSTMLVLLLAMNTIQENENKMFASLNIKKNREQNIKIKR